MLYLVEPVQTPTSTLLKEFHRNSDGSSQIKTVENFKPYFYVDENCPVEQWDIVIRTEKGYTSIDKTPVKKMFLQHSRDIKPLRQRIESLGFKHWEADIPFQNRYTIDLKEDIAEAKLKVCWFDIEVASSDPSDESNPKISEANQPICSITTKIWGKTEVWLCGNIPYPGIRYFPKEEDMLNDFFGYIYKESPDVMSAWNLDGFDLPYIITRCKRIGVDYKRLSKILKVKEREFKDTTYYNTTGTIQFDLLTGYKLWRKYGNFPLLESYSLDFVAKTVLKEEKLKHGKSITWLWHNDVKTLVEYNIKDVELLEKIDERCKVIRFFDELRRKCRIQFLDVYKTTAMIDGYLLNRLQKSVILPTSNHYSEDKFGGAEVMEPVAGIYDNVICEDVKGMYPSIIKTCNISYETVGGDIVLPIGISFKTEPGIIPMFLDELKAERKKYQILEKKAATEHNEAEEELYHQRQYGTKVLMNSFFGYLGFPGSRLYRKEVAAAITGMGVYTIREIIRWVSERGNKVIYSDTDSVYLLSKYKDAELSVLEGQEIQSYINERLEEMYVKIANRNFLEIEFEKVLQKVVFTEAKKRYAYILLWTEKEGFAVDKSIKIQGFAAKRSDTNYISKLAQKAVIQMLLEGKTKKEVTTYLRELNSKMKRREFTDEQLGVPKGITQPLEKYDPPSAHIKGAIFSNEHFDTKFGEGSKPKMVYIKGYRGIRPEVRSKGKVYILESIAYDTEIPAGFEIDWAKMSEKTFTNTLEKLFSAVGWQWESLDVQSLW